MPNRTINKFSRRATSLSRLVDRDPIRAHADAGAPGDHLRRNRAQMRSRLERWIGRSSQAFLTMAKPRIFSFMSKRRSSVCAARPLRDACTRREAGTTSTSRSVPHVPAVRKYSASSASVNAARSECCWAWRGSNLNSDAGLHAYPAGSAHHLRRTICWRWSN